MIDFITFYLLLDKGVFTWGVFKLCFFFTCLHFLYKIVIRAGKSPAFKITTIFLILSIGFIGARASIHQDRLNGYREIALELASSNDPNALNFFGYLHRQGISDTVFLSEYALLLIRLGHASDSVRLLDFVAVQSVRDATLALTLARGYKACGKLHEAVEAARRSIDIGENDDYLNQWAFKTLEDCLLLLGKKNEATKALEEHLLSLEGDDAKAIVKQRFYEISNQIASEGASVK